MKTNLSIRSFLSIVVFVMMTSDAFSSITLFGLRSRSNSELYSIDSTGGGAALLGDTEIFVGDGLAPGPNTESLWAMNRGGLYLLSTTDGSSTLIRNFGSTLPGNGLAFDRGRNLIYASDHVDGKVYSIVPSTGALNLLVSGVSLHGLAFSSSRNTLYGVSTDTLYSIDTLTGVATVVGALGVELSTGGSGLAYDPLTDVLYATSRNQSDLFSINPETAVAVSIGALGVDAMHGLAVIDTTQPPTLKFTVVDDKLRVDFSGFLQRSTNLKSWTTISPQPQSPLLLNLNDVVGQEFYRSSSSSNTDGQQPARF